MEYYLFDENSNYIGVRGSLPSESERLIAIEQNEDSLYKMENYINPKLINGLIVETASQQDLEQYNKKNIPEEVALWKIRFILNQMGLESTVNECIKNLEEPTRTAALYIWNYGTLIERNSKTVLMIKSILSLSEEDVDNIFKQSDLITL